MFTEKAIAYINSQRLLRVATVSANNQPDNTVTGFEFDGKYFYLGSSGDLRGTRRGKNVLNGNTKVALIIDDREDIDDDIAEAFYDEAFVIELAKRGLVAVKELASTFTVTLDDLLARDFMSYMMVKGNHVEKSSSRDFFVSVLH